MSAIHAAILRERQCCCCSVANLCPTPWTATPWTAAHQISLSLTISQSLPKFMSIESVMQSNLSSSVALFSSCLQSCPASVFSNESVFHIRWPKYWSFSFSISPSKVFSGMISFKANWFDLLAVQGTLKSLFQHHSFKASILWQTKQVVKIKIRRKRDFPGDPVAKTPHSQCKGPGFITWSGMMRLRPDTAE